MQVDEIPELNVQEQPSVAGIQNLVSIIVLTHNKSPLTRRCLASLLKSTYRPLEIVAVDNASADDTPAVLERFAGEASAAGVAFRVVRNAHNVGCSTGRNQGIATAQGEFVLFVDNDVLLRTASWAQQMIAAFRDDETLGVVGPKLVYPFPPYLIQFAGGDVSPTGRVRFAGRGDPRDDPRFARPRFVQCFITACMMVPRAVIDRVGCFDEAFNPIQYEDIDYCYRVRELGRRVLYLPAVEFYHFENITSDDTAGLNYRYLTVKNGMRFKRKWQHRFSREGGPPDHAIVWKDIAKHNLQDLPELELLP